MLCRKNATVVSGVIVWLLAVSFVVLGSVANADEQNAQPPSLDDELFGDLGDDSLDSDVEQELFGDDPMPPNERQDEPKEPLDQRRINAWNELLEQELAETAVDEARNPLLGIARSMRLAENLIEQRESGEKTQKIQSEIIADIDTLLKQAKKKCQSCSSKCQSTAQRKSTKPPKKSKPKEGSPKPKPATTSNAKPGSAEGEMPDMGEMMAVIKEVWGELPEQERQEMLQLSVEEFLPKYADLIERYFKRLAEDRKAMP